MVVRSYVGLKDEWGQVDARVSVELVLLITLGHVAWAATAGGYESVSMLYLLPRRSKTTSKRAPSA